MVEELVAKTLKDLEALQTSLSVDMSIKSFREKLNSLLGTMKVELTSQLSSMQTYCSELTTKPTILGIMPQH